MTTSTIRRGVRVALLSAGLTGAPASLTAAPAAASSAGPPGATVLVSFVSDDLSWFLIRAPGPDPPPGRDPAATRS